MNLTFIQTFLEVADCSSMNKVAEKLYITPPAVKRQMDAIENELGAQLFTRTPQGMKLTEAGYYFYEQVKPLYGEFQELASDMKYYNEEDNLLRVCSSSNYFFPYLDTLISNYLTEYSEYKVKYNDTNPPQWLPSLKDQKNDIGLCTGIDKEKYEKLGLNFELMGFSRVKAIVVKNHPLASKGTLYIDDLENHDIQVLFSLRFHFNDYNSHHYDVSIDDFVHSRNDVINFCNKGGVYITTESLEEQYQAFTHIPLDVPSIPLGLYYRKDASQKILDFIEFSKNMRTDKEVLPLAMK